MMLVRDHWVPRLKTLNTSLRVVTNLVIILLHCLVVHSFHSTLQDRQQSIKTETPTLHSASVCLQAKWLQLCPTLHDPMNCSMPGSSVHGIPRQENWSGLPFPTPGDLSDPGIKPMSLVSPALAGKFFTNSAN